MTASYPTSPARVRFNWGFHDGAADRKNNRYPQWARSWQPDAKHPFDQTYGRGYWAGRNGAYEGETTSDRAWSERNR